METHYYTPESLSRVVEHFERVGMTSEEFMEAHRADAPLEGIPAFHRHTWASFYRDIHRMSGSAFADNAERVLALPA